MSEVSNFFSKRRSVIARKMSSKPIDKDDLNLIIESGIRVPDHGALNPWKLVVIQGDSLKVIDTKIILSEFNKKIQIWIINFKKKSQKNFRELEL